MGLFEKITGEFIDIIEWLDPSNDTIAYRFERFQNEIKMGAQLTVRPGQKAVFVNEGEVADVFEPGRHQLSTQNLPILTTLKGWKYGFNSPFKAEVYFFSTRLFTNLKWGTSNPIIKRDPEMGPVRLRAFGTYNIKVSDPRQLLEQLISTDGLFQVDEVSDQIRNMIVSGFANTAGASPIPLLDFASRYRELGNELRDAMQPEITTYGLELAQLLIENISLPAEVETALDKRASMGVLGNMQQYAQFQAANAIEASANNPGGGGTPALDFGVGIAMGQQMMNAFSNAPQPAPAPAAAAPAAMAPPPPPVVPQWYFSREGQNFGPFSLEQLFQNAIAADTFVWKAGMENWLPAREVPDVLAQMTQQPPPPPAV
ncbi:MAG: SPFH domain-containing protein [Thermosynechococcaceae cyanobacterium]